MGNECETKASVDKWKMKPSQFRLGEKMHAFVAQIPALAQYMTGREEREEIKAYVSGQKLAKGQTGD